MKLQLRDSTVQYLMSVIEQLELILHSEDPILDEDLIEAVNIATGRLDISAKEFAEKFGVTPSTISRWKNGKSMPIAFARKAVIDQVIQIAKKQVTALEAAS